nr:amidase [uncultured Rhodoferax sp.]
MASHTDLELNYLSATDALTRFRDGSLSPVELLNAHINRIEELEPSLNIMRSLRFEKALEAAKRAETTYRVSPATAGPLEGIPTVLKNEHNLIGEETDSGSLLLAGLVDEQNAPLVDRLLDAGSVIHGRTHVPEFYVAMFTRTLAHGVTRNPWNPYYTCGGSSGGSAASLAAGMTTLASASDIGGSGRVPAAYCGVVGFKPSYGRIPEATFFFAMNTYNHNCVMARTVADAVLMFNVMSGPHPCDPASLSPKLELPTQTGDVKGMRIALSMDLGYFNVAEDVRRNTRMAAQCLREQGAIVDEVELAWDNNVPRYFTNGLGMPLGRGLKAMVQGNEDKVSDYVLTAVELLGNLTPEDYLESIDGMGKMHSALQDVYAKYDVLLCPTLARNTMAAEGCAEAHKDLMENYMTYPFNMLSRHPVMSVPSGFGDNGVPTGLQVVGRTYQEVDVVKVASALEKAINWPAWRPSK